MLKKTDNIIVLNPGTSTLKWAWFSAIEINKPEKEGTTSIAELDQLLSWIKENLKIGLAIVRFVHGGNEFFAPIKASNSVLNKLIKFNSLAPLHNPNSLICVEKISQTIKPIHGVYAVFDTEFFQNLPIAARTYALPSKLIKKHAIRRFGFHGFAHQAMLKQWEQLNQQSAKQCSRVITLQLGSGCSMAAIKNGVAIDTSMGFTPNEGLMMATRCGDIDAGLVNWLQITESLTTSQIDTLLNQQSGWLGLSDESADMGELLKSQSPDAELAIKLFCYRIRKMFGAYYAILGGLDAVILSGGIAENSTAICQQCLANFEHLGIELTTQIKPKKLPIQLSSNTSKVACWIVENGEFPSMLNCIKQSLNVA